MIMKITSKLVNVLQSFLHVAVVVEGIVSAHDINVWDICPYGYIRLHKSAYLWEVKYVLQFFVFSFLIVPSLRFQNACCLCALKLKGIYISLLKEWMTQILSDIWLDSLLMFFDTSFQGKASQYSPTGGCLWDQKRVLPLPWTVSSDVWWAKGKPFCLSWP